MPEEIEYVFHNLKFFHQGSLRTGSILIQDGKIVKFGAEPVINSLKSKHERLVLDGEDGILLSGIHDQLSWLDGIRTDQDLRRMKFELYQGGVTSTCWYWSQEPTRVAWLDMARRFTRMPGKNIIYGIEDHVERWKKINLCPTRKISYYPLISEYTILYGKYNNEINPEVYHHEAIIQKELVNSTILGTTLFGIRSHIPYALNLFYDLSHPIDTMWPLRTSSQRKQLWATLSSKIAVGYGITMEGHPSSIIGKYLLPLLITIDKERITQLDKPDIGSKDFVILKKQANGKIPRELFRVNKLSYDLLYTFVDNEIRFPKI